MINDYLAPEDVQIDGSLELSGDLEVAELLSTPANRIRFIVATSDLKFTSVFDSYQRGPWTAGYLDEIDDVAVMHAARSMFDGRGEKNRALRVSIVSGRQIGFDQLLQATDGAHFAICFDVPISDAEGAISTLKGAVLEGRVAPKGVRSAFGVLMNPSTHRLTFDPAIFRALESEVRTLWEKNDVDGLNEILPDRWIMAYPAGWKVRPPHRPHWFPVTRNQVALQTVSALLNPAVGMRRFLLCSDPMTMWAYLGVAEYSPEYSENYRTAYGLPVSFIERLEPAQVERIARDYRHDAKASSAGLRIRQLGNNTLGFKEDFLGAIKGFDVFSVLDVNESVAAEFDDCVDELISGQPVDDGRLKALLLNVLDRRKNYCFTIDAQSFRELAEELFGVWDDFSKAYRVRGLDRIFVAHRLSLRNCCRALEFGTLAKMRQIDLDALSFRIRGALKRAAAASKNDEELLEVKVNEMLAVLGAFLVEKLDSAEELNEFIVGEASEFLTPSEIRAFEMARYS